MGYQERCVKMSWAFCQHRAKKGTMTEDCGRSVGNRMTSSANATSFTLHLKIRKNNFNESSQQY